MKKILIVGQTPPPYHGQAIMIQKTLKNKYNNIELFHVPLDFSRSIDEIGKFRFRKLIKLITIPIKIAYQRFKNNIDILYYPPAGPNIFPIYRDIILLLLTRRLFKKTIFHFRAAGISNVYKKLGRFNKFLFKLAYFNPDIAIRLSELNPDDSKTVKAKKEFIVPNGIEDNYDKFKIKKTNDISRILFVGILKESKGVLILLEACSILRKKGINFKLRLMGKFASKLFEKKVKKRISELSLKQHVSLLGVLIGDEKLKVYSKSDIFCFPTFYECEAFPSAILEAMQFKLPIISTKWRGIPSIVKDNKSGYLVPIKDSKAVAEKLEKLSKNPKLRDKMGKKGREIFLKNYTIDKFYKNMEKVFNDAGKE